METNGDHSAENELNPSSLSSSTHTSSMSEEEPSLREINDTRLTQALKYLNDEGGDDSPDRYMERVFRIHNDLVLQLPHESNDFDITLHDYLRAVSSREIRVFNDTVWDDSPVISEDDGSVLESEDSLEGDSTSVAPALYRSEAGVQSPVTELQEWSATSEIDYTNLHLSDIRSRLELPALSGEVEKEIKRWCTAEQIEKAVRQFRCFYKEEELNKGNTLRACLDKMILEKQSEKQDEQQGDLADVHHAVNGSPTNLRTSPVQSSSQSTTSKTHTLREQEGLGKLPSNATAPSPVARKIDRSRAISLKNCPRRQSGVSTAPPSAEINSAEATILQQGPGDDRESNNSATNRSQSVNTSADVAVFKRSSSKKPRRKRSIGERAYTPEKKRKESATPSSLKKSGDARLQTPEKSVRFMSEDSDNMSSDSTIAIRASKPRKVTSKRTPKPAAKASPKPKTNPKETSANVESNTSPSKRPAATRKSLLVKNTTAKPAAKSGTIPLDTGVKVTKKVSKAVAAAKAVRDDFTEKKAVKNGIAQEAAETRSTRNRAKYSK